MDKMGTYSYPQVTTLSILGFVIYAWEFRRAFSALGPRLRGDDDGLEIKANGKTIRNRKTISRFVF
ncbi:hypothetical protein CbuK_1778 [Coxiella burnetii CbuK_Q154]|nr:hypothetical protein CbuK_1778 [Coxiella burnetii CbuK_Q154]